MRTPAPRLPRVFVPLLLAMGCAADPVAQVRLCSDLTPGVDVQQVRLTLRSPDREAVRFAGVRDLVALASAPRDGGALDAAQDAGLDPGALDLGPDGGPPDAGPAEAPDTACTSLLVIDVPAQPAGAWVEVQGLAEGVAVVEGHGRLQGDRARVSLTRACIGVVCGAGQACVAGVCASAPDGDDGRPCAAGCAL